MTFYIKQFPLHLLPAWGHMTFTRAKVATWKNGIGIVLRRKLLRKQSIEQFLILYKAGINRYFFQTFFVNNLLTKSDRQIKFVGSYLES